MNKSIDFPVHPSRFLHRDPNRRKFTEGDIVKTYSADLISNSKRIRGFFEYRGKNYVCTSLCHSREGISWCEAAEVLPVLTFQVKAEARGKAQKPGRFFYFGVLVKKGRETFILGESFRFVPDPGIQWSGPEEQGNLFDF